MTELYFKTPMAAHITTLSKMQMQKQDGWVQPNIKSETELSKFESGTEYDR